MAEKSPTEPENDYFLLPPVRCGSADVALELRCSGAWIDGTYHPGHEEAATRVAISKLKQVVLEHGKD